MLPKITTNNSPNSNGRVNGAVIASVTPPTMASLAVRFHTSAMLLAQAAEALVDAAADAEDAVQDLVRGADEIDRRVTGKRRRDARHRARRRAAEGVT